MLFPIFFSLLTKAHAQTLPNPKISSLTYTGTGCPSGTLSVQLASPSASTQSSSLILSLDGSTFVPTISPGLPLTEQRKTCAVHVDWALDAGWKLRVNAYGTDVKGNALLDANETLTWKGTYFWNETNVQSNSQVSLKGPLSGIFHQHAQVPTDDAGVVGPCGGGTLNINHQARLVSTSSNVPGWIDDPDDDTWVFVTAIEVLAC